MPTAEEQLQLQPWWGRIDKHGQNSLIEEFSGDEIMYDELMSELKQPVHLVMRTDDSEYNVKGFKNEDDLVSYLRRICENPCSAPSFWYVDLIYILGKEYKMTVHVNIDLEAANA